MSFVESKAQFLNRHTWEIQCKTERKTFEKSEIFALT